MLKRLTEGVRVNPKKEFQFFATPDDLADRLIDIAFISQNNSILEPSAGQGSIVKAIHRRYPETVVDCFELMDINLDILTKVPGVNLIGTDFLKGPVKRKYDRIIANPPFSKNQDIDHVRAMFDCLSPKGVLVSITSKHWSASSNKKEMAFKDWLDSLNAGIFEIKEGEFKESGTMVGGLIVRIQKP